MGLWACLWAWVGVCAWTPTRVGICACGCRCGGAQPSPAAAEPAAPSLPFTAARTAPVSPPVLQVNYWLGGLMEVKSNDLYRMKVCVGVMWGYVEGCGGV